MKEEQLKKYLKGTTTVGLVCKEGVVLATDKRATMGHLISDKEAQKVYQIDDKLAMTTAGLVGDAQSIVRIMKAQLALAKMEGKPMSVKMASTLLANVLHSRRYYPFLVQLIVGGHDNEGKIYELDPVGGVGEKKISSTGSGSPVAYGVLEAEYRENMNLDQAVNLAVKSIRSALERDAATGNGIDVVTITDRGFRKYEQSQVDKVVASLKA